MDQIPGTTAPTRHDAAVAQSPSQTASTPSLPGRDSSPPPPPPPPPHNAPGNDEGRVDPVNDADAAGVDDDAALPNEGTADDRGDDDVAPASREPDVVDDTALSTANDREATELTTVGRRSRDAMSTSSVPTAADSERSRQQQQRVGWAGRVQRWWGRQVHVAVEAGGMRDHLALERTFLGYLRTSIALSMTGVMIAQLFRLQHAPAPDPVFGFHALGKPLAGVFIGAAIAVTGLGAVRFWRQQNAMIRGKVWAGGWEIWWIMGGSLVLTITVFGLVLAVDIRKEMEGAA